MPHPTLLPPRRRSLVLPLAVILTLLGGCGPDPAVVESEAPPPAVTVVAAHKAPVQEQYAYVGRVAAPERVELQARVQGFLKERLFREGQDVKVGEVLYLIEPEQYQADVTEKEADLAKALAEEQNARAQLARGQELLKQKYMSQAEVDERQAKESVAKASVAQARAALEKARLDLSYTRIIAPIAGRIGLSKYTVGNLVGPPSGTLATIVSSHPIQIRFPLSQRDLLDSRRDIEAVGGDPTKVVVSARLPDGSIYEHTGTLDFMDVSTDRGTDTVIIRAIFPNPRGLLVDGQYAGVLLAEDKPVEEIVIPQAAIQTDQQGNFVMIVDAAQKVESRRVKMGAAVGSGVVIQSGLTEGDLVITEGLQKVRPGMVVTTAQAQSAPQLPQGAVTP